MCGDWLLHNVDRVTEGVACYDRTDASTVDVVDDKNNDAQPEVQSIPTRTHEKADMAVVSAAYPGKM